MPSITSSLHIHRLTKSCRDLLKNRFTGIIPEELGGLTRLSCMQWDTNLFEGGVPASIASLTNMRLLTLYNNSQLRIDALSDWLGALTRLETLCACPKPALRALHLLTRFAGDYPTCRSRAPSLPSAPSLCSTSWTCDIIICSGLCRHRSAR